MDFDGRGYALRRFFDQFWRLIPLEGKGWFAPEFLAVYVGIGTAILVIIQLLVMVRQTKLMKRQDRTMREQTALSKKQTDIAETQAFIVKCQLARRPKIRLKADVAFHDDQNVRVVVTIDNDEGDKGMRDYHWHLLVPHELLDPWSPYFVMKGQLGAHEILAIGNGSYFHFSKYVRVPLYPRNSTVLGYVVCRREKLEERRHLFWRIECEDGIMPEEAEKDTEWAAVEIAYF